jgi:hypothetical protein
MKTFDLNADGVAAFFATLTADTYVLVAATITIFSFICKRYLTGRARRRYGGGMSRCVNPRSWGWCGRV